MGKLLITNVTNGGGGSLWINATLLIAPTELVKISTTLNFFEITSKFHTASILKIRMKAAFYTNHHLPKEINEK
jgi:uncharacterized protein (UPF0212 family)